MDFTVGIVLRDLATTSNSEKWECHVFRGTESSAGHLAHFEWLKMRHVSNGELVKHELKWDP